MVSEGPRHRCGPNVERTAAIRALAIHVSRRLSPPPFRVESGPAGHQSSLIPDGTPRLIGTGTFHAKPDPGTSRNKTIMRSAPMTNAGKLLFELDDRRGC